MAWKQTDYGKSLDLLERAAMLAPFDLYLERGPVLAVSLTEYGDQRSIGIIAEALKRDPYATDLLLLAGKTAFKAKNYPLALSFYLRAYKTSPDSKFFDPLKETSLVFPSARESSPLTTERSRPDEH